MMLATAHFAMEDPEVGLESRTTLDEGEDGIPFAENTELRGEILLCPGVFGTDSFSAACRTGTKSTSIR